MILLKRILLIGNCYTTVVHFRKELIEALVQRGYDVWMTFPNHSHGETETGEEAAEEFGCKFLELKMDRRSSNPFKEIGLIHNLKRIITRLHPDCVLTFTVKPNIYAGMICANRHIPYIMNITGLGSGFDGGLIGKFLIKPYINNANKASKVFFQNSSDYEFFLNHGYDDSNAGILPGSGVNLDQYHVLPYRDDESKAVKTIFLYNARVMKEKGIDAYLAVAKNFKGDKNIEFHICGDCEDEYEQELEKLSRDGTIIYHGRVSNMMKYLEMCDCLVIPSFYHEGISNCLLEAAACGRPIITTDHPGCREVVDDGVNGYLVNKQDVNSLYAAVDKFLGLSLEDRKSMGLLGRKKVEKEFDRNMVINRYLETI